MSEKRFHNHCFNQTNAKQQCKPKTEPRAQPQKMLVHTKLLQQPKQNQKMSLTRIN